MGASPADNALREHRDRQEDPMSAAEIDACLDRLDEPERSTLGQLRRDILATVP